MQTNNPIVLNHVQSKAVKLLKDFLTRTQLKESGLFGLAGSGKSTVTKFLIEAALDLGISKKSIAITAPTHAAVDVISAKTGLQGVTLHSLLGLRPNVMLENYNPESPEFAQIGNPKLSNFRLIFLDECSMVNQYLYKKIREVLVLPDSETQVIFVGDHAQLKPVKSTTYSPIFTSDTVYHKIFLDKVMRQADGNPVVDYANRLRDWEDPLTNPFEHVSVLNEREEGVLFYQDPDLFVQAFVEEYKKEGLVKIQAFKNERVSMWNDAVRRVLYGRDNVPLQNGELLMAYKTYTVSGGGKSEHIKNNINYYVFLDGEPIWVEEPSALADYHPNLKDIKYRFQVQPVRLQRKDGVGTILTSIVLCPNNRIPPDFKALMTSYDQLGKNDASKREKYNKVRRNYLLLGVQEDQIRKDLDFGYAVTVHKSQGLTYDVAFCDFYNIESASEVSSILEMKYVALSRPSKRAYIYSP